jgi:hypothetical protein
VFTSEDPLQPLPYLGPIPHPAVSGITITQEGVQKLLCHLNPHKAPVPGQVSPRLLKETAKQKIKNVIENVRYLWKMMMICYCYPFLERKKVRFPIKNLILKN